MTEETTSQIIYLDDHGNVAEKEKATQARIIEYDANGERVFETYGVLTPNNQQEVDK